MLLCLYRVFNQPSGPIQLTYKLIWQYICCLIKSYSANIDHLTMFLSDASCLEFEVCLLVFKKNKPIAIRNWKQTRNFFWLRLLMCFNSKKITAVLFLDYQHSTIVQMRCKLTKLSQQQIFWITIISKLLIGQC